MIRNLDPSGSVPAPDEDGCVVLTEPKESGAILYGVTFVVTFLGFVMFDSNASDPSTDTLLLAITLSTVALGLLVACMVHIAREPVRLVIDEYGLRWFGTRGEVEEIPWQEMREIKLVSRCVGREEHPLSLLFGPHLQMVTLTSVVGAGASFGWGPNFGVSPGVLAAYLLERQGREAPGMAMAFRDERQVE